MCRHNVEFKTNKAHPVLLRIETLQTNTYSFSFSFIVRYKEVCESNYDFNEGNFNMDTGHFTQVIWKDSVKLGLGRATAKKGDMLCTYIVARYRPSGNYDGKFKTQVQKGSFTDDICSKLDDLLKDLASASGGGDPDLASTGKKPKIPSKVKTPDHEGERDFQ